MILIEIYSVFVQNPHMHKSVYYSLFISPNVHSLTILSHITLTKFATTFREIF
jgi:hypothetical protein